MPIRLVTYPYPMPASGSAKPSAPPVPGEPNERAPPKRQFSHGFMKPSTNWRFGGVRSFGSPGTGGALGFADPDAGIGYAYVTSRMGTVFTGDPRDVALRDALYTALESRPLQGLATQPPERIAS